MNDDQLRRACEVAGLEWIPDPPNESPEEIPAGYPIENGGAHILNSAGYRWPADDPALPAYVASLLVAMVREQHGLDYAVDAGHPNVCLVWFTNHPTAYGVESSARGKAADWIACTITAALEVFDNEGAKP